MGKTKRETILFSCLGSTDPVRGERDGAMLHIARHYKPERILWYMTKEMRLIAEKDNRYVLSIEYLKKQCPGNAPEILPPCCDELEDASDFDAFYDVFEEQLRSLSRKYPDAEILVNLSSGTPQMKTTLALLSSTLQFPIRAIQVKNFENRSGTTERTNAKTCDLEYELELNEDAEPGAPNRCSEPKLMLVQRDKQRAQIASLLRRRFRQPQPFRPGIPGGTSLRRGGQPVLDCVRWRNAAELRRDKPPAGNPAYIACIADNLSAAADRREIEGEGGTFVRNLPLSSIFRHMNGEHGGFSLPPYPQDGTLRMPQKEDAPIPAARYADAEREIKAASPAKNGGNLAQLPA